MILGTKRFNLAVCRVFRYRLRNISFFYRHGRYKKRKESIQDDGEKEKYIFIFLLRI
jgi:hypothetical protein